jgi:hypothetical protein
MRKATNNGSDEVIGKNMLYFKSNYFNAFLRTKTNLKSQ